MANLKSSKKDVKRIAKKRAQNTSVKSAIKTYIKKAKSADGADSKTAVAQAVKALDKAASNGVMHKNQAARRKSRMMKAVNKAAAAK